MARQLNLDSDLTTNGMSLLSSTSHTLSGEQVLMEWSDCTSQEVHRGGYIAMILTSNMDTSSKGINLNLKVAN